MNKIVVLNFIKDKLFTVMMFTLSFILIISYNSLKYNSTSAIIYSIILYLFILSIYISYEFFKYYNFNNRLLTGLDKINDRFAAATEEQKNFQREINRIQNEYIKNVNGIMLEERNKRYFLSQWIHNMKTPISVINLMLENMEDSNDELKKRIKFEVNKLYENLEKVLNILRLEDFSRDYVPCEVDIIASLKEVINSKRNTFIYNRIYPKIVCDLQEVKILTDKKWNEFMLSQIISNAIKYSTVKEEDKDLEFIVKKFPNKVLLIIKDYGIGIPKHDIKRIFEPFFTGENGRIVRGSSGIGLYMVKLICEKLNHKVAVHSLAGEGTSFDITYLSKM